MRWGDLSDSKTFETYMTSIDQRLIGEGVDVEARPMRAWSIIQRDLQVAIAMPGSDSERIFAWFKDLYGDRLHIDFSMGRVLVMLRGNAWAMKIARTIGAPPPVPLVRMIEKSTELFIRSLTTDEIAHLKLVSRQAMDAFAAMEKNLPLEVQADWKTSVDQVVANQHSYGLSKWSSQQAVERYLTPTLQRTEGEHAYPGRPGSTRIQSNHLQLRQSGWACSRSIDNYSRKRNALLLPAIQGASTLPRRDAVAANQASVFICGAIARQY
jgi:hypothetical protein